MKMVQTTLAIVMVALILQGCASTIPVRQDTVTSFQEKGEKLPVTVALLLDKATREHVIVKEIVGASYNFQVGEAISASGPEALRRVFKAVSVIEDKKDVPSGKERLISLKFGPESKMTLGSTLFSEHTANIVILCEIYGLNGDLLWKAGTIGVISRKTGGLATAAAAFGGLLTTPIGESQRQKDLGRMMDEALTEALEQLNDRILTAKEDIMPRKME